MWRHAAITLHYMRSRPCIGSAITPSTPLALHNIAFLKHLKERCKGFSRGLALMLAVGMTTAATAQAQAQTLDVLHWWTSAGERRAVDQLVQQLDKQGVTWNDAAIPGGAGVAAMKVLKSRVLAGDPPDVAQVIGRTLTDWADLGLVLPLDNVAQRGKWKQAMFPVVLQVVSHRGHVIAAPLGVHRINTLLYNQRLWSRFKLPPPKTWDDVEKAAEVLRRASVMPFAWSDEPWQVATVFETLLLGEGGASLY